MAKKIYCLAFAIFLIILACPGHSRLFTVSDGVDTGSIDLKPDFIRQNGLFSSESSIISCEETYGFLPCTNTVVGNIFLILVYGSMMFFSAKMLSDGSEILLQILGPGIIGGLFLPLLGALPDSAIILASGLSGDTETAQSQVSVGMGLMAGSTVLLLTLLWGSCLIAAKCDIQDSVAVNSQDTKRFSLTESGVTIDVWTSYAARIMIISVIPFIIAQLPQVLHTTSQSRLAVLISLISSICLLISYSLYQVLQPWIQKRKLAYAKQKKIVLGILEDTKICALGRLFMPNGEPNRDMIFKLFKAIDGNSDGYLNTSDLRAFVIGIRFEELDISIDDIVDQVLKDFDTSGDSQINVDEFVLGVSKWIRQAKLSGKFSIGRRSGKSELLGEFDHDQQTEEEDEPEEQNAEVSATPGNAKWNSTKAVLILISGTIIAAAFADPLVDAVENFSTASGLPTFFISFVILPFASSSEAVSVLIFSSRKNKKSASLAYSEIYGSVTMGNVLSLSVFLGLVYFRGLTWDFSSEVLVILIVCVVMGLIASFRTTFPLWMAFVAYSFYPFSLLLVYVLQYVLGWD
ncbi:sodium/calcium exchanger family protein / calcium-binding EF hand family protein [Euphorbia peplus]|nr:sodium/calcium exchanger family protein / calcium-binding EF hand family protein [Euphorbia peplus]